LARPVAAANTTTAAAIAHVQLQASSSDFVVARAAASYEILCTCRGSAKASFWLTIPEPFVLFKDV